jgi:DNA-binding HxlR family transcriptional regulator
MPIKRAYDDGCAAAHALDLVGERWALLVVRELLLGPRRFTDLRATLPTISPNVLSQRLKDLEDIGVLRRRTLPPPAASAVYELSDWGRELEPVLQQLGRWGARSPQRPREAPISLATFITALKTMFSPEAARGVAGVLELRLGEELFGVRIEADQLDIVRGPVNRPDAVLQGDHATLGALVFGGRPLDEALRAGDLQLTGDRPVVERFLGLFPLPAPAPSA